MNYRVLIVDDEPFNRQILRLFLQSLDYDIVEAESGEQALLMIDIYKFDIILLDYMMPSMSGMEVLRTALSRENFNVPIIMLSANVMEHMIVEGLQLGAFDYLLKPYDLDLLERRMVDAISNST